MKWYHIPIALLWAALWYGVGCVLMLFIRRFQ